MKDPINSIFPAIKTPIISTPMPDDQGMRLINKQTEDFLKHVQGGDLSEILLKGHLLVEHYLDHIMLLKFNKNAQVHKKSFDEKIKALESTECFYDHKTDVALLYSLNRVRNELAHRLDFKVTISQIDAMGYHLGKDYILNRYSEENGEEKKLLLWVIKTIIENVFFPIYQAIMESKKS